jgi:hypothetical protein
MSTDTIIGNGTAAVVFDRFDLSGYDLFLRAKKLPESQLEYHHERDHYVLRTPARYAAMLGATDAAAERIRCRSPATSSIISTSSWSKRWPRSATPSMPTAASVRRRCSSNSRAR